MHESAKHMLARLFGVLVCIAMLAFGVGCSEDAIVDDVDQGAPAERIEAAPAQKYVPPEGESSASAKAETPDAAATADAAVVQNDSNLIVRFIDVGQGDCALITCGGQSLLIDGGPSSASSKLYAILKNLDIGRLDYIIVTHPDADHCGGVSGALNYASCGTFYCSVTDHDTKTFKSILRYLEDTPVSVPTVGDSFRLGDATVTFLAPVLRTNDTNEDSLVCKITYGNKSFLFTGDAGFESEGKMLYSAESLDVDVLKVGHHGSKSATSVSFLDEVTPEYAIISVGKNSYGHPTDEVLGRLAGSKAQVLRTDELGTITIETDGEGFLVTNTKGKVER